MCQRISHGIISAGLLFCLQGNALASSLYEGVTAYNSGDYQKAFELWAPLALQGDHRAQYNLGMLYSNGKGVDQNEAEAIKWYQMAAEQGNKFAKMNLREIAGKKTQAVSSPVAMNTLQ
jgi:hypothetical protein